MDLLPTALVLLSALLHATWNVMVKQDSDRLLALMAMSGWSGLMGLAAMPFVALPGPEVWPYLAASAAVHVIYKLFLAGAYRHGDLGQVYPVARGSAPLMVALIAFVAVDESLGPLQLLAVSLIATGVMSLAFRRGLPGRRESRALAYAFGTALMIAGYTVIDGIGARLSDNVLAFGAWLFVIESLLFISAVIVVRGPAVTHYAVHNWQSGFASGFFSTSAYVLVLWALTLTDMALVSALRETSVLFGTLLGAVVLREAMGLWRISCAAAIVTGLLLLHA